MRGRKDRCIFILQVIHIGALIVFEDFCYEYGTTTEDVMIILGDTGINYWLDLSDKEFKGTAIWNEYYIFLCSRES